MASKGFFAGSKIAQAAPTRTLPQCGACKLHHKACSPKMPVAGEGRCSVLFVGDAPSGEDDSQGAVFVGKYGTRIRRVLKKLNINLREDAWSTYAVTCHTPKGRTPSSAEVMACRPNMDKVIKELKPQVIIPMGAQAVNSVLGKIWREDTGTAERWAGWQIPCQAVNAWVCPTWHPRYLDKMDDQVLDRQFKRHIQDAFALPGVPWPEGPPEWGQDVRRVLDPAKAAKWLLKCAEMQTGAIAWDYETNMLKPDGPDAQIVSCSVAWGRTEPERCIAFPWQGEAIPAMQKLLAAPIPKIASNLKFEDRWTRKEFGHRVRAWAWDTMLAAHVCDNRRGITSVKFQAFVRLGVPCWNDKIEPFLKTKGDARVNAILREIDIMDLLQYNGLDSLLEFRVATDQISELGYPMPWQT